MGKLKNHTTTTMKQKFTHITLILFVVLMFAQCGLIHRETETTSPNSQQVEYAREFLYINPELDIEPQGYVEQKGFDYHVRLKFIAKTDEPIFLFDSTEVNSDEFTNNFSFAPPEASIDESWWDVYSQTVAGGNFWVPKSEKKFWRLTIGYYKNNNGTLTVYAWRHECGNCTD
jgi:hypothetical protein